MKVSHLWLMFSILTLSACQSLGPKATELTLSEANANAPNYRNEAVKVCGFGTNQFENSQITEFKRENHGDEKGASLGVDWSKNEVETDGPEKRCITGELWPKGGWGNYERKIAGEPYDVIIGGGSSGTDWKIRQTSLARD